MSFFSSLFGKEKESKNDPTTTITGSDETDGATGESLKKSRPSVLDLVDLDQQTLDELAQLDADVRRDKEAEGERGDEEDDEAAILSALPTDDDANDPGVFLSLPDPGDSTAPFELSEELLDQTHFRFANYSPETALRSLPVNLDKMTNLQNLALVGHQFGALQLDVVWPRSLTQLSSLEISHCQLEHFAVGDFPVLTDLNLSNNRLRQLPECLIGSKNLISLDLSHNNVHFVHQERLAPLSNLRRCFLHNNEIASLNDDHRFWKCLSSLSVLTLDHNKLRSLPSQMALCCEQLVALRFTDNELTSLPGSLSELLDATRFALVHLKDDHFTRQGHLCASHNRLPAVPIQLVLRCKSACLSRNSIASWPASELTTDSPWSAAFFSKRRRSSGRSPGRLSVPAAAPLDVPDGKELTSLATPPSSPMAIPSSKAADNADGSPVVSKSAPSRYSMVWEQSSPSPSAESLLSSKLCSLDLSWNRLELNGTGFQHYKGLVRLDLSHTAITRIPDALSSSLTLLEFLSVADTPLRIVTNLPSSLVSLAAHGCVLDELQLPHSLRRLSLLGGAVVTICDPADVADSAQTRRTRFLSCPERAALHLLFEIVGDCGDDDSSFAPSSHSSRTSVSSSSSGRNNALSVGLHGVTSDPSSKKEEDEMFKMKVFRTNALIFSEPEHVFVRCDESVSVTQQKNLISLIRAGATSPPLISLVSVLSAAPNSQQFASNGGLNAILECAAAVDQPVPPAALAFALVSCCRALSNLAIDSGLCKQLISQESITLTEPHDCIWALSVCLKAASALSDCPIRQLVQSRVLVDSALTLASLASVSVAQLPIARRGTELLARLLCNDETPVARHAAVLAVYKISRDRQPAKELGRSESLLTALSQCCQELIDTGSVPSLLLIESVIAIVVDCGSARKYLKEKEFFAQKLQILRDRTPIGPQRHLVDRALVALGDHSMLRAVGQKGRHVRILSLDGGGTKGMATLAMLKTLESRLNSAIGADSGDADAPPRRPLHSFFDLVCGTSTGGIIAVLLSVLKLDLDEISRLYRLLAKEVFAGGPGRFIMGKSSMHDSDRLAKALKDVLTDRLDLLAAATRSDVKCFVVATNTSTYPAQPYLFRTYQADSSGPTASRFDGTVCARVWEALLATSAAPLYLKPVEVEGNWFIDGGLLVNNPAAVAIHEANRLFGRGSIACLVSVGTGRGLTTGAGAEAFSRAATAAEAAAPNRGGGSTDPAAMAAATAAAASAAAIEAAAVTTKSMTLASEKSAMTAASEAATKAIQEAVSRPSVSNNSWFWNNALVKMADTLVRSSTDSEQVHHTLREIAPEANIRYIRLNPTHPIFDLQLDTIEEAKLAAFEIVAKKYAESFNYGDLSQLTDQNK